MTSSAAAAPSHRGGFRHELLLHRSTQELLEFVVPMVREGVAAQEPTLLLRAALRLGHAAVAAGHLGTRGAQGVLQRHQDQGLFANAGALRRPVTGK